jgi:hypothetical protein
VLVAGLFWKERTAGWWLISQRIRAKHVWFILLGAVSPSRGSERKACFTRQAHSTPQWKSCLQASQISSPARENGKTLLAGVASFSQSRQGILHLCATWSSSNPSSSSCAEMTSSASVDHQNRS